MRFHRYIPTLFVVATLAACDTKSPDPNVTVTQVVPTSHSQPRTRCFLSVTPSTEGEKRVDTVLVQVTVADDRVFGRMDWIPGERDRMLGVLDGTVKNDTITAVYSYEYQGMSYNEQRLLHFGKDYITMLTGEMIEQDGMMVLKDPTKAVESTKVPEVHCP
ncbi:MAG: hypothetical protein ABI432_00875 [Flavobacteriales bacterium]